MLLSAFKDIATLLIWDHLFPKGFIILQSGGILRGHFVIESGIYQRLADEMDVQLMIFRNFCQPLLVDGSAEEEDPVMGKFL